MNSKHEFDPSWTGMVCKEMFVDEDGCGDVCGLPATDTIHEKKARTDE